MDWGGSVAAVLDAAVREAGLFAGAGFLLLGLSDLAVDALWLAMATRRLGRPEIGLAGLPSAAHPGRIAVFIPAWDEAAVIAAMLRRTLRVWDGEDFLLYVGCYPNDPATLAAVASVADRRLRLVVGGAPGPTTKGDCLGRLWEALLDDEAAGAPRAKAVVLHDAEDLVHPGELRLFDALVERFDFVQLPVVPLIDPASKWIGGSYADDFAQAHGKEMPVRARLGAGLPSAGVGCAFSRAILARIGGGGSPFGADSLTEDYELGLKVGEAGGSAVFACVSAGAASVATRAYFPGDLDSAVAQRARWTTGIALAGWDRLGWSGGWAERWMRLRDRQAPLAALLLAAGWSALLLWLALAAARAAAGAPQEPLPPLLEALTAINASLLAWRLALRAAFTGRIHGWREGLRAIPRAVVGNWIAIRAAAAAVGQYRTLRRTGRARWHKTAHFFPAAATGA